MGRPGPCYGAMPQVLGLRTMGKDDGLGRSFSDEFLYHWQFSFVGAGRAPLGGELIDAGDLHRCRIFRVQ